MCASGSGGLVTIKAKAVDAESDSPAKIIGGTTASQSWDDDLCEFPVLNEKQRQRMQQ